MQRLLFILLTAQRQWTVLNVWKWIMLWSSRDRCESLLRVKLMDWDHASSRRNREPFRDLRLPEWSHTTWWNTPISLVCAGLIWFGLTSVSVVFYTERLRHNVLLFYCLWDTITTYINIWISFYIHIVLFIAVLGLGFVISLCFCLFHYFLLLKFLFIFMSVLIILVHQVKLNENSFCSSFNPVL